MQKQATLGMHIDKWWYKFSSKPHLECILTNASTSFQATNSCIIQICLGWPCLAINAFHKTTSWIEILLNTSAFASKPHFPYILTSIVQESRSLSNPFVIISTCISDFLVLVYAFYAGQSFQDVNKGDYIQREPLWLYCSKAFIASSSHPLHLVHSMRKYF